MLTGKIRYRIGFGNKLVLQVQDTGESHCVYDGSSDIYNYWRDARVEDLGEISEVSFHRDRSPTTK